MESSHPSDRPADDVTIDRCVSCESPLDGGGCCSSACAASAQRELKRNANRLHHRYGGPDERRQLAERNGRLSSALLRWRPATRDGSAATMARRGQGQLVLVADDEPAILTLTRHTLEASGYRVVTAAHGREALEAFELHRGELAAVVVDLIMPVMDGYQTIEALRSAATELPIVATSGANAPEAKERALRLGAARFLAKPYQPPTLVSLLAALLADAQPHAGT